MVTVKGTYTYWVYAFCIKGRSQQKSEYKIAHVCLKIEMYLFQKGEVDLQNSFQDTGLKQQSLQVLIEQQTAAEAT